MQNWFIEGIMMTDNEAQQKNDELRQKLTPPYPDDLPTLWEIRKLWAYRFFRDGNGYRTFKPFLYDILGESNDSEPRPLSKYYLPLLKDDNNLYYIFFYKHCWLISGGEDGKNGRTSRMRKNVLRCIREQNYDSEDYSDYIFREMLLDEAAGKLFQDAIENRAELPPLNNAIKNFQKNSEVNADVAWFLSVNGNNINIILGVIRIDIPNGKGKSGNVIISDGKKQLERPIPRLSDSVFFTLGELAVFFGEGELKIFVAGVKIEHEKFNIDAMMQRLRNETVCFENTSSLQRRWYKLVEKDADYHKSKVWIVDEQKGFGSGSNIQKVNADPLGGNVLFCGCLDTVPGEDFNWNGVKLFHCRLTPYIEISGVNRDICDENHKWEIFTGTELRLCASVGNDWSYEPDISSLEIEIQADRKEVLVRVPEELRNQICNCLIRSSSPRKTHRLLYLPLAVLKCIGDGTASSWEDGWSYSPNTGNNASIHEHVAGRRFGTLAGPEMPDGVKIEIPLSCKFTDSTSFCWLEQDMYSYHTMDATSCDLSSPKIFDSYTELQDYHLCFPFETHDVQLQLNDNTPILIQVNSRSEYKGARLDQLVKYFNGEISDAEDSYHYAGKEIFRVKRHPAQPQMFQVQNEWKIFVPEKQKNQYCVLFMSSLAFEDLHSLQTIPCSDFETEKIVPLTIPLEIAVQLHAVYAFIGTADKLKAVKTVFETFTFTFTRIRVCRDAKDLFRNHETIKIVWDTFPEGNRRVFSDVNDFLLSQKLKGNNPAIIWQAFAGTSFRSILWLMNYLLDHDYNFLMEPYPDANIEGNYGKTWLSEAFEVALRNHLQRRTCPNLNSFSGNALDERYHTFSALFLDNQDTENENFIHGEGWLPAACTLYLLKRGRLGNVRTAETCLRKMLEGSGIREVTKINQFGAIWNYQLAIDSEVCIPFAVVQQKVMHQYRVIMPHKNDFLHRQKKLYNTNLDYLLPDFDDPLYAAEDLTQSAGLLQKLLVELEKSSFGRPIAKHLLITFSWILENILHLVENSEEDLNHAVLGLTAIACRLYAHANNAELLDEREKTLLLTNVRKAFMQKYNAANSDDNVFQGDCWRFLMHYIIPVDMAIYYYNYQYKSEEHRESGR